MEAKELRIGNYIHEFGIQTIVDGRMIDKLEQINLRSKICIDLSPIELTEEWLVKFGFVSKDSQLFTNSDGDSFYLPDIKLTYVHQLQNLYFAITGKELSIKK